MSLDKRSLLEWMFILPSRIKIDICMIFATDFGFDISVHPNMLDVYTMHKFISTVTPNFYDNDPRMKAFLKHISGYIAKYTMQYLTEREQRRGKKNFDRMMAKCARTNG